MLLRAVLLAFFLVGLVACQKASESPVVLKSQEISRLLEVGKDNKSPISRRTIALSMADSIAMSQDNMQLHIACLRLLGTVYLKQQKDTVAEKYFLMVLALDSLVQNPEDYAVSANNLGIILSGRSDHMRAISYYQSAQKLFGELKKPAPLAQSLLDLSISYKNIGNMNEAFNSCINALHILDTLQNARARGYCLISAAIILKELNNKDNEAIEYLDLAVNILSKEKDSVGISMAINSKGNILRDNKNFGQARTYYNQSLAIKEKFGSLKSIATTVDNIGELDMAVGNIKDAASNFVKALAIRNKVGDKDGILTSSNRLARLYLLQNDLRAALKVASDAYHIGVTTNLLKFRLENALILADIYKGLKMFEMSLYYQQEALVLTDSIFKSDMASAMSEMRIKYKTEQKEKELLLTKQQMSLEAEKSRNKIYMLIAISSAVFLIVFLVFYFYRKWERYQSKQQLLEVRQEALRAQLDTHFISDTIDSINTFVEQNNREAASEYLLGFSRLIRTVLENSFKKMVELQEELYILQEYINLAKLRFPNEYIFYEVEIAENINPEVTMVPPMVLHVLVENAMKHAFNNERKGNLLVKVFKKENATHCIVEDNGIGRQRSMMGKAGYRRSFGNSLAEKLIKTLSESETKASYIIDDLVNEHGDACGTRVEISFPFLSND